MLNLSPLTGTLESSIQLVGASASDLSDALYQLEDTPGVVCRLIRGCRCVTKDPLMNEFSAALQFRPHFGSNWDALLDSISDVSWLRAEKLILGICDADFLLSGCPEAELKSLALVFNEVIERWNSPGKGRKARKFHLVITTRNEHAVSLLARWQHAGFPLVMG